jgi:hypothetical protein
MHKKIEINEIRDTREKNSKALVLLVFVINRNVSFNGCFVFILKKKRRKRQKKVV